MRPSSVFRAVRWWRRRTSSSRIRHFRLDWSSAGDIGRKAAAASLSDINAMGGRASALLVGLAAPPDVTIGWIHELCRGLQAEVALVGASVIGGDLTAADAITIAVTALGACEYGVVRRSGASSGDRVALAGRQGWAAAGFAVLGRGFRSPKAVVEAHRRPTPPYDAGPGAAQRGATAMIDVSDGLLQDLDHIAAASNVAIDVSSGAFEVAEPLAAVGAALGVDPLRFILTGGDDYGLLATFPPGQELVGEWLEIGTVGEPASADDPRPQVTVDGSSFDGPVGHQHWR